jgi:signal transduction histidine kinase
VGGYASSWMRVLVVEDEGSMRTLFSELLAERGHEVTAVGDATSAILAFEANPMPLIITDWEMRGMTGLELCRIIRSRQRGADPFIIFITGRDKMSDVDTALMAGADDFLVKPTRPNAFRTRVAIAERTIAIRESKRRAEAALIASEQRFAAVFKKSPAAIGLIRRHDYAVIDVNEAFCKLFVQQRDDFIGSDARRLAQMMTPDIFTSAPSEMTVIHPPNHPPQQALYGIETVELNGELCWLVTLTDVTERERLRAQLLLSDRMASLGTLAAGVAHEINNPLAYTTANVDFVMEQLREQAPPPLPLLEALEEARQGSDRIKGIVGDLRTFSRADKEQVGPVNLHAVLDSAVNIVGNEIRHRARLERDYHEIPFVRAHAGRLGQVFVNLLANAAQSITEGDSGRNLISIRTGVDQDGMVYVTIADTGCGISADHVSRVFDPFFTTKAQGEGTGLGLSICQALVMSFGGQIVVDSEVGLGSIFLVTLPAAKEERRAASAQTSPRQRAAGRRGRILVIDDEVLIVRSLLRILHHDHDVDTVTSAREGLDRLDSGQSYDLILCDLMMPEMTGMDLHAELRTRHNALLQRIVFLTGGAFTPRAKQFLETAETTWIEKPVDMHALREMIQKRLETRRPA